MPSTRTSASSSGSCAAAAHRRSHTAAPSFPRSAAAASSASGVSKTSPFHAKAMVSVMRGCGWTCAPRRPSTAAISTTSTSDRAQSTWPASSGPVSAGEPHDTYPALAPFSSSCGAMPRHARRSAAPRARCHTWNAYVENITCHSIGVCLDD